MCPVRRSEAVFGSATSDRLRVFVFGYPAPGERDTGKGETGFGYERDGVRDPPI